MRSWGALTTVIALSACNATGTIEAPAQGLAPVTDGGTGAATDAPGALPDALPDVPSAQSPDGGSPVGMDVPITPPRDAAAPDVPSVGHPTCAAVAGGGAAATRAPTLLVTLADHDQESWLGSPAVADLDRDGTPEIVMARDGRLVVWHADGRVRWAVDVSSSRIWASPVVGDFTGDANLEVVVAAGAQVFMYSATGAPVAGFPVAWRGEVRAIAGGDVDADGRPEIVAVTTDRLEAGGQRDIVQVFRGDGRVQPGYPPNTTGTGRCDGACDVTGGYDQNIAVGHIDGDATMDILAPMDDAYISWHRGTGEAFPVAPIFHGVTRAPGVRMLLDLSLAMMGYAPDESTALQAHFTNSAPAIADIDGDGTRELVVLGSVQNAAQTNRQLGVALWVLRPDGTRPGAWVAPFYVPTYLAGLADFGDTNVVAATNQVSVADMDPAPGLEMVFAGFDGRIHCVGADRTEHWSVAYTTAADVLTPGVLLADLSGDGRPEVIFATYSPRAGASALYILDAHGVQQQRVALPDRGAMAVPTVADVNRDGTLEIVVSLKDAVDGVRSALVFTVPGSAPNCAPWPTGRGDLLRTGYVPL